MAMRIGTLTLDTRVLQSPMAGCTDLAFRLVARPRGMGFAFLEMVSATALVRTNRKTLELMRSLPEDRPLGAQLIGSDPAMMAEASVRVEAMGFELLDLNLGCPAPKMVKGEDGAGAALLTKPERASEIFRAVLRAVRRIPVTVKMRIGFTDASGREALEIARRAQDSGILALCVHGRTRQQGYTGKADYEAIGRVKRAVSIPVFGNGDVYTGEDARRLTEVSGCDAVMIGRGGLGNPWLYREAEAALSGAPRPAPPSWEDRLTALGEHLEHEVRIQGSERALRPMRRVACWYVAGKPGAAEFRRRICAAATIDEMRLLIESLRPSPSQ
ncbi:MAG: tRNA dihydrouridine synthase DusB [Elusimicrobia bacterium GWA2_69_24]|nr:MAG: tRNA dihydrouridine synthase DusB [Elusimicrobia bacterium GWA2_69_24]HBL19143.1 tRNA dihydrouridine synthase DusB [Elusimicrobiota bacterium]